MAGAGRRGADNAVLDGIRSVASLLAAGRLVIHESCEALIRELEGYAWDPKASERGLDAPLKEDDHGPDALRYAVMAMRRYWRSWITLAERDRGGGLMALPANPKQSWPPLRENGGDLDTWAAWYSGDPQRLTADAQPQQNRTARLFFWKRRTPVGKPQSGLHMPLAGELASVSADLLFGDAFDLTVADKAAAKRLDELRSDTSLQNKLLEGAETCAALGGAYLRASWDKGLADEPFLTTMLPDHAVPEFRYGRLTAVTFWREAAGDAQKGVVLRHLERHERGVILHGLYRGEKDLLGHAIDLKASPDTEGLEAVITLPDALAKRLAVAYVPNVLPDKRRPTSPQGRADVEGCESLLDALDETYTSWMRDIRLGKSRIVVPADALEPAVFGGGRGAGKRFDADREVFTELEVDPQHMDITPVQFDLRTAEHAETALHLFERIVSEAGYSPQTFGLKIEGRAESGTALRLREARTFKTMARKQRYWAPALADACELLLILDGGDLRSRRHRRAPARHLGRGDGHAAGGRADARPAAHRRGSFDGDHGAHVPCRLGRRRGEGRSGAHPGRARRPRTRARLLSVIDPEQLARLAHRLVEQYREVETLAFALITRRLAKDLGAEDWAGRRLAESAALRTEVRSLVRHLGRRRAAEVASLLTAAHALGADEAAAVLGTAGASSAIAGTAENTALAALLRDLSGRLGATDLRILRATSDVYRQVIARVTAQGLSGEYTRRQAAQAALNLFADRGITGFVDVAGRRWNLPSYAEMACRTAANGAARQGALDRMRAAGRDLAVIGGSSSGCELCADWEGEVVSLDGATPGYPTLDEAEGAGLFHPNCGHMAYPWTPGLTEASGVAHSDLGIYEARQQQRYLERGIRVWKTRQAVALDDSAARAAQAKVRDWQGRLREHVAANGLKRLSYREQIGKAI